MFAAQVESYVQRALSEPEWSRDVWERTETAGGVEFAAPARLQLKE